MKFGPLVLRFDDQVLRPRPWTLAQSSWAAELFDAELFDGIPEGAVLELCAGVGQIGLALASLVPRDLVLVDADEHACSYAQTNAEAAGISGQVDVRNEPMHVALAAHERFALILADPPWVRSGDVAQFPRDPVTAIDGGPDGLDVARICVDLIGHHLSDGGAAILQLGDADQAATMRSYLDAERRVGLTVREVRTFGEDGVLVLLARR